MVISTVLREKFIENKVFENHEAFLVLRKAADKVLGMKVPTLQYVCLNSFEDLKNKDFF